MKWWPWATIRHTEITVGLLDAVDQQEAPAHPLLEGLPIEMADVCAAASNPMEIAAALEARGVSSRVASDRFGGLTVFGLAERLFNEVPARQVHEDETPKRPRRGGARELLRGAMFAAPAIMFTAALRALHLHLPSWTFLLALTSGWAFGQAIAAVSSSLGNRGQHVGPLALWWLTAAAGCTAGLALIGDRIRDGGFASIAVAVVVALYVVSCSVLLLSDHVLATALPLVPATGVALLFLLRAPIALSAAATAIVMAVAVTVTIGLALRNVTRHFWRLPKLRRTDVGIAAHYFGYGMMCGLATSLIIVLSSNSFGPSSVIPVASYPVLLTLGVMEWQLHSFRARATTALRSARSSRQFSRQAWRAFLLSLSIYLLSILAVCIAIAVDLHLKHSSIPVALLVAETCLGCIFFVGLVASTCARMNVALAGSTVGAIIYALLFLSQRQLTGSFGPAAAQTSCCIALGAAMIFLVLGCKSAIRSAFSYQ